MALVVFNVEFDEFLRAFTTGPKNGVQHALTGFSACSDRTE